MDAQNKKLEVFNRARQCKLDEEDNTWNEKYTKWYKGMDQQAERVVGITDDEQEKEWKNMRTI